MARLFGTDGLRGVAGEFPLDHATIELLGRILYFLLSDRKIAGELIVGRDTRESGPDLFASICRGFSSGGGTVDDAGVLSTPALAYLARIENKCAISITASHNPYRDNGIKIFGPDGFKMSEEAEREIEPYLLGEKVFVREPVASDCNRNEDRKERFRSMYSDHLVNELFPDLDLSGMRIGVDCANGALSDIAPDVLRRLGADVTAFYTQPNGKNINDGCGALYPDVLYELIRNNHLEAGFTFDGDGDRCLAADPNGTYDGDFILALSAIFLQGKDQLKSNGVVATSMSNLGLEVYLKERGIHLHRVPVGDKYVLEKLKQENLSLGGEQSGHIIFRNDSFIGDGLLTALQILRIYRNSGKPFSQLWDGFKKYPQILLSVPARRKPVLSDIPEVQQKITAIETELSDRGRIVVRYSGTEPLARIMIEGPEQQIIDKMANDLSATLKPHLS